MTLFLPFVNSVLLFKFTEMAALLFAILGIILLHSLFKSRQYFISPVVAMAGSFLVATSIVLLNPQWDFILSIQCLYVICFAILAFYLGTLIPNRVGIRHIIAREINAYIYEPNYKMTMFFLSLQWAMLAFFCGFIYRIGNGASLNAIKTARIWMLHNDIPNIYGHIIHLSFSVCAVYIFLLLEQVFIQKKTRGVIYYILVIIPYIFIEVFSSSRTGIIYLSSYFLALFVFFLQKKLKQNEISIKRQRKKIVKICFIISVSVFLLFILLGNITGKTGDLGIVNMVSTYFGGSIYNLNYYVNHLDEFKSPSWGYFCFPILKSILRTLGQDIPDVGNYYFPMHLIPSTLDENAFSPTNLYTCIAKPMTDFGLVGMMLFFFTLGLFYGISYRYVVRSTKVGLNIIYYGFFLMPLIGSSAEYLFGTMLFAPYALYRIIYIYCIFNVVTKKHNGLSSEGRQSNGI